MVSHGPSRIDLRKFIRNGNKIVKMAGHEGRRQVDDHVEFDGDEHDELGHQLSRSVCLDDCGSVTKVQLPCSSDWNADMAKKHLGVKFVPARFGSGRDTSPYLKMLHAEYMAGLDPPDADTLNLFDELFHVLDKLDVDNPSFTIDQKLGQTIFEDLEKCFDEINKQEKKLDASQHHYARGRVRVLARSYERMLKFMSNLRFTLWRCLSSYHLDEENFRQLFMDFAWIFRIAFRAMNTNAPLIVKGQSVATTPDLLYEDLPPPGSDRGKIVVIAVGEVKRLATPRTKTEYGTCISVNHDHDHGMEVQLETVCVLNDESSIDQEIEDDSTVLPDKLRGQHACQLVQQLPATCLRNKDCMLGFIVQATKVRLTCLIMSEEHRGNLESENFNSLDYDANIYYTRAYDMLSRSDRHHLVYILATLSGLAKFSKLQFE